MNEILRSFKTLLIPVQDFAGHFTEKCGPGLELEGCLL